MLDQIKGRFGGWWWCGLEGWRFVCGDVGEGASLHVTGGRDTDRAVSPPERPPPDPLGIAIRRVSDKTYCCCVVLVIVVVKNSSYDTQPAPG